MTVTFKKCKVCGESVVVWGLTDNGTCDDNCPTRGDHIPVKQRTIRQLPLHGSDEPALIHLVRSTSNRGYNGTAYDTYCGLHLMPGEKWAKPQHDFVDCVRCLGTAKACVKCRAPLRRTQLPSDVPERCEACAV